MHRPYRDLLNLKFSYLWSPKKRRGGGGGSGRGVVYHTSTGQLFFFFFFFFFEPGLKLDEKSIENGLEGQKCSVGCLVFSGGGCHHPNLDIDL